MKNKTKRTIIILICLTAVFSIFVVSYTSGKIVDGTKNDKMESAVASIMQNDSEQDMLYSECATEGHIILGYKEKTNGYAVYTLTMVTQFGFENGNFTDISGTGTIPCVINLNSNYELVNIEYTSDGGSYYKSIKKRFPKKYQRRSIDADDSYNADFVNLQNQNIVKAKEYLKSINRSADVGYRYNFENQYPVLTDYGVSVDVSNKISQYQRVVELNKFPYWIGNKEIIENGKRYLYETNLDTKNNEIIYTKSDYETGQILAVYIISSLTGELKK